MGDLSFGKEEKKTPESSLSAMWGLQWQGAIRKPGREPHKKLVKHQLVAWFWISQSPEWWEINFCVCSHPICGILLQLFEQTGTIPTEFLQRVSKQSRDNRRAERRITRLAVSPQRLHALLTVRHVSGSDPHTALEVESASLSQLHNCTILTSECSASNTQLPQKVSCPFDGSEKKNLLFRGSSKMVYIITIASVIQEKLSQPHKDSVKTKWSGDLQNWEVSWGMITLFPESCL